jgi:hypothetical protein
VIEELRPGLKRWIAPHPEWKPEEDELDTTYRPVASVLFHAAEALVFIDPLVPDDLWPLLDTEVQQSGSPVVVLTTIKWHVRSRDEIARRYGARLGGELAGIRSFPAARADEVALWLDRPRAVVFGDAVLGDQQGGLRLAPWFLDAEARERTLAALRPLLDLPVDLVLPAHGNIVVSDAKTALTRALEA